MVDPEGVRLNPPPCLLFLNILWKWNQIISFPSDIYKKWDIISKANPLHLNAYEPPFQKSWIHPWVYLVFTNLYEACIKDTKCGYCFNDYGSGAVNGSCLPFEADESTHSKGIIRLLAYCKGSNFNIHIWFGYFIWFGREIMFNL